MFCRKWSRPLRNFGQTGEISSVPNIPEFGEYYNYNYCVSSERALSTNIGRSPMKINPLLNQALKGRNNVLHQKNPEVIPPFQGFLHLSSFSQGFALS